MDRQTHTQQEDRVEEIVGGEERVGRGEGSGRGREKDGSTGRKSGST